MKNEHKYKQAFNSVTPSQESIEEIFANTIDKKKPNRKATIRRLISAVAALVIVIGIGFGADFILENNFLQNNPKPVNPGSTTQSNTNQPNSNRLGILVAYAGETDFLKLENVYESQKFFGRLYTAFHSDEEKLQKIYDEYLKEDARMQGIVDNLLANGIEPLINYHSTINYIYNPDFPDEEIETGWIISMMEGSIALNIEDYSNVKEVIFENSSNYFELELQCYPLDELPTLTGHKIAISGKDLQYAIDNGFYLPKGYVLGWNVAKPLLEEYGKNEDFDISTVKDTYTFTVHYLDGTTKQTAVDITFDKDGYMNFSDKRLTE